MCLLGVSVFLFFLVLSRFLLEKVQCGPIPAVISTSRIVTPLNPSYLLMMAIYRGPITQFTTGRDPPCGWSIKNFPFQKRISNNIWVFP